MAGKGCTKPSFDRKFEPLSIKVHEYIIGEVLESHTLGAKPVFVDGLLWWIMALLDARALGCNFKVLRALVCSHKVLHPDLLFPAILAPPACLVTPTCVLWPPEH